MRHRSVEEIYEDPEEYRTFLDKVVSGDAIREKTLMIRHPEKGLCHISTSTTALYDGQHNFQGGPLLRQGCHVCGGLGRGDISGPGAGLSPFIGSC